MRGFTLIEVLVVMAITVMLTGFMIQNFSRTRTDLNQTRLLVQDAIREAQSLALAGSLYRDTSRGTKGDSYRCGYGVHFETTGYTVYAGPDSSLVDCTDQNRNFEPSIDQEVRKGLLSNNMLEIMPAPDIFFEPPNPTTYIDNKSAVNKVADIIIRRIDAMCVAGTSSADCRTIHVTTSGLITTQ